ncbi:MAG: dethiobiotin synthase [Gammaproteobacteria bacterium]|nr:dethiobiotin synthase [Gammaproteobacteria bacterium]
MYGRGLPEGCFITGTDTECGKTEVTLGLMHLYQSLGETVVGMKPIASGAQVTEAGLRNEDAVRIQHQASESCSYQLVNPYTFQPPIAPHLAAGQAGVVMTMELLHDRYLQLAALADRVVVEGVGGWQVPLGGGWTVADLARTMGLPVILVVGLRLGCINHALLSVESITRSGCTLAGWVANRIDTGMLEPDGSIDLLTREIEAPLLGVVPPLSNPGPAEVAACLALPE